MLLAVTVAAVVGLALGMPVEDSCTDGVGNVIKLSDCGGSYASFSNLVARAYHGDGTPACSKSLKGVPEGEVNMPGKLKIMSGQVTMKGAAQSLTGTDLMLGYGKDNSWIFGNICKDGKIILGGGSSKACDVANFCPDLIGADICNKLAAGGTFDISELPTTEIDLPAATGVLEFLVPILNGHWHIMAKVHDKSGAVFGCIKTDDVPFGSGS